MKCMILAAGYATRLYPLTENFPKPLLDVGGKTIIDRLVDDIDTAGVTDEYIVISNHKFAFYFDEWAKGKKQKITVVDDGTITNETRLGAVRDILFATEKLSIDDDIFVMAGDNVLDFSLVRFISYIKRKNASCVMRYYEANEEKLKKCGVIRFDDGDRILNMTEKPQSPETHWCVPPFYYYTREDARLVEEGIKDGCGTDAPGSFAAWLCQKSTVYAMEMPGRRFDVGNIESYNKIKSEYKGITIC